MKSIFKANLRCEGGKTMKKKSIQVDFVKPNNHRTKKLCYNLTKFNF